MLIYYLLIIAWYKYIELIPYTGVTMKINEVIGNERRRGLADTRTNKDERRRQNALDKVRAKEKTKNDIIKDAKGNKPDTKTMSPIEAGKKNHK